MERRFTSEVDGGFALNALAFTCGARIALSGATPC
jgi:hypothetical protein